MSPAQSQIVADRYRLVEPLGQGGMGRVWKARDELLHRDVAIKELIPPGGLTQDERQEMRERTLREARAIARFNHPNVVRIFDILRTDGDPWIVMEYVANRSLQEVVTEDGPMPHERVVEIGLGMLAALRAAHRAGVVHRDVKPGNVLLGYDGRVVLTDFGLATVPGDPVVTRTGLVLGSPAYIAPERAHDGSAGPAADMWSLGATLYAAVEGQSPYARPSAIATLAALATEAPAPARRAGPLKPVLSGLLRKDPNQRITAEEAERLLQRAAMARKPRSALSLLPSVRRSADPRASVTTTGAGLAIPRHLPGSATLSSGAGPKATAADEAMATALLGAPMKTSPEQPRPAPVAPGQPDRAEQTGESTTALPPPPARTPPRKPGKGKRKAARAAAAPVPGNGAGPRPKPATTAPAPRQPVDKPATPAPPAPPGRVRTLVERFGGDERLAVIAKRPVWWISGLVAVLVLTFVVTALVTGGDSGTAPRAHRPAATPSGSAGANAAVPGAGVPGAGVPTAASPSAATPGPAPSSAAPSQPTALPAGWRTYHGDGFDIGVPSSWDVSHAGSMLQFREPGGEVRIIGITKGDYRVSDPLTEWRKQMSSRIDNYPGYQQIGLRRVPGYFRGAADWEFNYTINAELHVIHRGVIVNGNQWYGIFWLTPERTWAKNKRYFDAVMASFRPTD